MDKQAEVRLTAYTASEQAYAALPALARPYGQRFVLAGGHKAMRAGQARLMKAIAGSGLELAAQLHYGKDCTWQAAQRLAQEVLSLGADFMLGMGGGRALDTVKAAADMAGLPVLTLPTTAATCAAITRLSVMYDEQGGFERFYFLKQAPRHCLINLQVLAEAPVQYLRAGLGDSLAKHVEAPFAARGQAQSHADGLGLSIAEGIYGQIAGCAAQAIADNRAGRVSEALLTAALCSIVSTGYVALLVQEAFNGALAHSLYYALEHLPQAKALLHGDMVAWGAAVQLVMDGQEGKARELLRLLKAMGTPASLQEMGIMLGEPLVQEVLQQVCEKPDMQGLPYAVNTPMVLRAVSALEALSAHQ